MEELIAAMARIEQKLDILIAALAEEPEQEPFAYTVDLMGEVAGRERDQSQPL